MKIAIVIPTIRDLDKWFVEWSNQLFNENVIVYIVEDHPNKILKVPPRDNIRHYCWQDIDKELGEDSWIISRFNSGIRSYGFYKAWQDGCDFIITLDDDCFPADGGEIVEHLFNLTSKIPISWINTLEGEYVRGFPYELRKEAEVVLSHGLWLNNPDFDAITELKGNNEFNYVVRKIPKGIYFPMCIMNLGFRKELIPCMYQLLQGKDWAYDRFDDIWSGIIVKKIIDHLGYGVLSGKPLIRHERKSNKFKNLIKEAKGVEENEVFWKKIDEIKLANKDFISCYQELWEKFKPYNDYFIKLKEAALIWINLFK